MGRTSLAPVLHFLRTHLGRSDVAATSDEHLLERFAFHRDEAAFEAMVERHGPLVWGVCRRVLKREQDIEDAFQATFLVLVRKAHSIRRRASVTSWLHGVAHRVALQARASAERNLTYDLRETTRTTADAASEASYRELRAILDEEIQSLPERFRTPLLLCCLEGRTKAEAARELGWKEGTVASRLARARQRLHGRMTRRGIVLAAGPAGLVLVEKSSAAVPVAVVAATVRMAVLFAAGEVASVGGVSTSVAVLAKGILNGMVVSNVKVSAALILTVCFLAAGVGWAAHHALQEKPTPEQRKDDLRPEIKTVQAPESGPTKDAKKDIYGDPLPPGVLARMGTAQLRHHAATVRFSDDGKTLMSAGVNGVINSWDVATGKLVGHELLQKIDRSGRYAISGGHTFSGDGKTLLNVRNKDIQVFDVDTGKELCSDAPDMSMFTRATLSFDGKLAAGEAPWGRRKDSVYVWEARTGKELHVLEHTKNKSVQTLAFSPDNKLLGVAYRDEIRLWDTETGTEQLKQKVDSNTLAFSADGKFFLTGHARGVVTLWDTASGTKQDTLTSSKETYIRVVAVSVDGKTVAAGGQGALSLWDVASKKELFQLPSANVGWLAFSPDGKTLASSGLSSLHLWDVATGKALHSKPGHDGWVNAVAVSPDGAVIASLGHENTLRLWNATTGKQLHAFSDMNRNVRDCAFSSDSKFVICATEDGAVRFWDVVTGKEAAKFVFTRPGDNKWMDTQVLKFRLSTDGKRLVALGFNHLTIWDMPTRKELANRAVTERGLHVFSPDGNCLVDLWRRGTVNHETVIIRDTLTGKERAMIEGDFSYFLGVSPDGKLLAVPSLPSVELEVYQPNVPLEKQVHGVTLIRFSDGKTVAQIKTPPLWQIAFSPDTRILASAHGDALRLWEVASGKELFQIKRPKSFFDAETDSFVACLAFMPSGKALVTGMADGTVLTWDLTPEGWSPKDLDQKALLTLWSDLADEAPKAYRAIWTLSETPRQAAPFLKEQLKPVEEVDAKQILSLTAQLDSDQFETREKAAKELAKLGERIDPILREELERNASEEVQKRVKALLDERPPPSGETLRTLRAIQVLERIGTKEACAVLKKLASGAEAARESREAKEALERLAGGTTSNP